MKLFVLGINFYPEPIGISIYTTEMCEYLIENGHEVIVFTGFPYYPDWKIKKEDKGRLFRTEIYKEKITIKRSYVFIPKSLGTIGRMIHELSFIISSFFNMLFSKRPDVIITISPPLGLGIASLLISKIKKVPFVFHIQDLQPDAVVELGMINSKIILKFLYNVEGVIYKRAFKISVISKKMIKKIKSKGISKNKILFFPNWVDVDFIKPLGRNNIFREVNKLKSKYIVLYSGNIGNKQGLDIILNVALKTTNISDIIYLIVGNGIYKKELMMKFEKLKLNNVKFLDVQPKEMLPYMISAADVCLILLKQRVTGFTLPSKLLNIMGCARPVIACANAESELYRLVKKIRCGKVVEPNNAEKLLEVILELYLDKGNREIYGKRGREYVIRNLSKEIILKKFERDIKRI